MKKRVILVDYMKGISICGIVMFHLLVHYVGIPHILEKAAAFAGAGVHLFNVCSAFGLTLSQRNHPIGAKEFYQKRFIKVYIPYAIAITLYFMCASFTYQGENVFVAYLSHIFLFKMFVPEFMTSFGGPFWYISTIFQFYIAFLFLIKLKNKLGTKRFLASMIAMSVIWMAITALLGKSDERVWNNFFFQYLWEFGLGMHLADVYKEKGKIFEKEISIIMVIAITVPSFLIFAITGLKGGILKNFNDFFAMFAIGGIYYIVYMIKPFKKLFVWLNKFSYELYLIHILVFEFIFQTDLRWRVHIVIVGLLALILSVISAYGFMLVTRWSVKRLQKIF